MSKSILFLSFLLASSIAVASPVTRDDAEQRARDFLSQRRPQHARRAIRAVQNAKALKPVSTESYYYVFNVGDDDGFVIVSGDDRTSPILGYADAGSFDEQRLPSNLQAWLKGYADQLRWLDEHPQYDNTATPARAPRKATAKNAIPALLTTTWNQTSPYNDQCPKFVNNNQSLTGCVATAMAQVMYYHQWPAATTKEIPSFQYAQGWSGGPLTVAAIPANTTFDWSNMLPSYSGFESEMQKNAIAKLMAVAGASVKMNYADDANGGSSAYNVDVDDALRDYFDYSATTQYVFRGDYNYTDWTDLIYKEIAEARPVFYSGQSSGGGHAFVVDGFDGEGYFHVNWGWGGLHNGHFLLSVLNSEGNEGAGASSTSDGYGFDQEAVIGIKKNEGEIVPEKVKPVMSGEIASVSGNSVSFSAWNATGATNTFDIGIGYVKTDQSLEYITGWFNNPLEYNQGYNASALKATVSGLADGTYKVVPICRLSGSEKWMTYVDYETEYVLAEISGGVVTLTHIKPAAPYIALTTSSFDLPSEAKVCLPLTITANVKNSGDEFYGQLFLFASTTDFKGTPVATTGCTIRSGETFPVEFCCQLAQVGTLNLWVATDKEGTNVIGQTMMTTTGVSGTTDDINISYTRVISPLSTDGTKLLSNEVTVTYTLTNPSTEYNYQGKFYFYRYEWTGMNGSGWGPVEELVIPANSSITWTVVYSDLNPANTYSFTIEQTKDGNVTNRQEHIYETYPIATAVSYYMADGTKAYIEPAASIAVPAEATAVDLRGNANVTTVTGGNPNTLYFLDETATAPTGANANIVRNGIAEHLVLADGYNFATPFDITANDITYDRTFATGYDRSGNGWSTITLPFAASTVTVTYNAIEYPIDWFRSSADTEKNFWIMQFDHEDESVVYFSHADEFRAGRPYIIAVPGPEWGDDADLTGLPLHFKATDVHLSPSFVAASMGEAFKMKGTVAEENVIGVYVLNAAGNHFEKNNASIEAFRAYFAPTKSAAGSSAAYRVRVSDTPTAIQGLRQAMSNPATTDAWHTLDGRRIQRPTHRGLYIHQGKKVAVK